MRALDAEHYVLDVKLKREKVPSFEEFPFCLPVVRRLDTLELHPKVTFIVGENGSGKSTLLEGMAIAWGFNPEGGSRNFNFQTHASHSSLHECLLLVKSTKRAKGGFFLRAESFFNVASEIDQRGLAEYYGGNSLHRQSHGESFFSLMTHRFHGKWFYILDEPEAALSPTRQLAALARLHQLVREGSQFIIATHSPILMAYPDAWIYEIGEDGLQRVAYEDTEHYLVTRDFLADPKRRLADLMD